MSDNSWAYVFLSCIPLSHPQYWLSNKGRCKMKLRACDKANHDMYTVAVISEASNIY